MSSREGSRQLGLEQETRQPYSRKGSWLYEHFNAQGNQLNTAEKNASFWYSKLRRKGYILIVIVRLCTRNLIDVTILSLSPPPFWFNCSFAYSCSRATWPNPLFDMAHLLHYFYIPIDFLKKEKRQKKNEQEKIKSNPIQSVGLLGSIWYVVQKMAVVLLLWACTFYLSASIQISLLFGKRSTMQTSAYKTYYSSTAIFFFFT